MEVVVVGSGGRRYCKLKCASKQGVECRVCPPASIPCCRVEAARGERGGGEAGPVQGAGGRVTGRQDWRQRQETEMDQGVDVYRGGEKGTRDVLSGWT